jgi:integrase/recombinase XerC
VLLKEAVEEFLLAGLQEGWSRATHRQYAWHLGRWRLWLDDRAVMRLDQVSRHWLRVWGAGVRYQQWPPPTAANAPDVWKPATVRIAVIAVKALLNWCRKEGELESDLAGALKVPKVPPEPHRTMRPEEVSALLEETKHRAPAGLTEEQGAMVCLRNAAIVSLLYDSLLRNAELCRLRVADLDLGRRRLVVRIKGGSSRSARFGLETADRLRAWLAVRQANAGVDTVFVSIAGATPGQPLTTTGLRMTLRHLGNRAGIEGVCPHAFRRGGAVRASELGAPTHVIKEFGRWSSTAMVELYTRAMDAEALFDDYSPIDFIDQEPEPVEGNRKRKK